METKQKINLYETSSGNLIIHREGDEFARSNYYPPEGLFEHDCRCYDVWGQDWPDLINAAAFLAAFEAETCATCDQTKLAATYDDGHVSWALPIGNAAKHAVLVAPR